MSKVAIFNSFFFKPSETFIRRQVESLTHNFFVTLIGMEFGNNDSLLSRVERYAMPYKRNFLNRAISSCLRFCFQARFPYGFFAHIFLLRLLKPGRFDLLHAHYGWTGINVLNFAKRARMPMIVSFHGKDASASLRNPGYRLKLPELFDYSSAIVLCSAHMIESLSLNQWLDKVKVIPYGIDTAEFVPDVSARPKDGIVRILHSGRLVPKKGVLDLIAAFGVISQYLRGTELHIVGDGDDAEASQILVEKLSLSDRVFFYGALPIKEVLVHMQRTDVFVLNSRTDATGDMEGLPNALLEAMSCEMSVVSTRHAAIPTVIVDEVSGLLVDEGNNDQLVKAILRLCRDSELRFRLGRLARKRIVEDFSLERMTIALNEVVANCLK